MQYSFCANRQANSVSAWMDIDILITLNKMTAVTKHQQFAECNVMYILPISPFPYFPSFLISSFLLLE